MSMKVASPLVVARHIITRRHVLTFCAIWIVVGLFFSSSHSLQKRDSWGPAFHKDQSALTMAYEARGDYQTYTVRGYDNIGVDSGDDVAGLACSSMIRGTEIGVQKSWHLKDDLWTIAGELDTHPMVEYSVPTPADFDLRGLIDKSWARLATSCSLLPDHDVYLCITRIIFHANKSRQEGRINFLRGQIFNRNWVHLDNYRLKWKNEEISFPRTFDIPTDWVAGGLWYGPEDPRIIIEHDVEGAEPVIVFNMVSLASDWKRSMWIFRPFSGHFTMLSIKDAERPTREKNWTPLFVSEPDSGDTSFTGIRQPNHYIHFVHAFTPIKVLKCSLLNGMCDWVFIQEVPEEVSGPPLNYYPALRGGTQFIPIPLGLIAGRKDIKSRFNYEGLQAYVALPRTHVEKTKYCTDAVYRPEFLIMVTDGKRFMITYGSEPLDFGADNVADLETLRDPCGKGRILITNSIAHWDYNVMIQGRGQDVMTIQASVADATVQSLHITGVLSLIAGLPSTQRMLARPSSFFNLDRNATFDSKNVDQTFQTNSNIGFKVKACLEEKARQYVDDWTFSEQKLKDDAANKAEKNALNSDIEKFGLAEANKMHGIKSQNA